MHNKSTATEAVVRPLENQFIRRKGTIMRLKVPRMREAVVIRPLDSLNHAVVKSRFIANADHSSETDPDAPRIGVLVQICFGVHNAFQPRFALKGSPDCPDCSAY